MIKRAIFILAIGTLAFYFVFLGATGISAGVSQEAKQVKQIISESKQSMSQRTAQTQQTTPGAMVLLGGAAGGSMLYFAIALFLFFVIGWTLISRAPKGYA